MSAPRFASLVAATQPCPGTRLIDLVLRDDPPLGFRGGQYIIVDCGFTLANGKAAKRAYSLLSEDREQRRFQLAIKRIAGGPASSFLHEAPLGSTIKFSGPWGKLFPASGHQGQTLVLATDTGITAALGLVRGAAFAALRAATTFVWLRPPEDRFLPDQFVRQCLPEGLKQVDVLSGPSATDPGRVAWTRQLLRDLVQRSSLAQAFLAGDGAVNYALMDDLVAAGVPVTRDNLESFFNMPRRAAA